MVPEYGRICSPLSPQYHCARCRRQYRTTREPYTEQQAQAIVVQVTQAIHYLHAKHILHRDLKHENVLFALDALDETNNHTTLRIKVVDFGMSIQSVRHAVKGQAGTAYAMAPEVIGPPQESSVKSDTWSIGVMTYMLLSGGLKPFVGHSRTQLAKVISAGKYNLNTEAWKGVSDQGKRFVQQLLQVNPQKRYGTLEILNDPWLQSAQAKQQEQVTTSTQFAIGANFQTFSKASEFQKLALQAVAKRTKNTQEITKLRDAFVAMDVDHTGVISLDNMKKAMGSQYSEEEVENWFQNVDVNGTGTIEYTEFLAAALGQHCRMEEQRIALAFDVFDPTETGEISHRDLREILGDRVEAAYVEDLIAQVDKDGNGKISYEEFKQVFDRTIQRQESQFRDSMMQQMSHHLNPIEENPSSWLSSGTQEES